MAAAPEEERDVEIEDEEGYVNHERRRDIVESRRKIVEVGEALWPAVKRGELTEDRACRHWHENIRNYILNIEPLLKDESLPSAEEVWLDELLGVVELKPPEEFMRAGERPGQGTHPAKIGFTLVRDEPPEPVEREITGLKDIVEVDEHSHTFELQINKRSHGISSTGPFDRKVETVSKPHPKQALVNAVRVADSWLQEAGIGLEIGENHHAKT